MPHSVSPSPTVCSRRRAADDDRPPLDEDVDGRAVLEARSPDERLDDAPDSDRALLAVALDEADAARGMRSVCPGRIVSDSIPFASRTASTVVS